MFADLFGTSECASPLAPAPREIDLRSSAVAKKSCPKPVGRRNASGFVGLSNQGATCYLNSLVQTMFMTPELRTALLNIEPTELGAEASVSVTGPDDILPSAQPEPSLVEALMEMGLGEVDSRRALLATGNAGIEAALDFLYSAPPPPPEASQPSPKPRWIPLELQRLFSELILLDAESVSTQEFTTRGFQWTVGDGRVQHDAHELNRLLIDALDTSLRHTSGEQTCKALYLGELINEVRCLECGACSPRSEEFFDLNLQVRGCAGLVEALAQYLEPELLTGDCAYHCGHCRTRVDAQRSCRIARLPPVLSFACSRFDIHPATLERVKIATAWSFPVILDMECVLAGCPHEQAVSLTVQDLRTWAFSRACDVLSSGGSSEWSTADLLTSALDLKSRLLGSETLPSHVFVLHSVVVHRGSAYAGHYFALIRDNLDECTADSVAEITSDKLECDALKEALDACAALEGCRSAVPAPATFPIGAIGRELPSWARRYKEPLGSLEAFLRRHRHFFVEQPPGHFGRDPKSGAPDLVGAARLCDSLLTRLLGKYIEFNDHLVRPTTYADLESSAPYLLVYRRVAVCDLPLVRLFQPAEREGSVSAVPARWANHVAVANAALEVERRAYEEEQATLELRVFRVDELRYEAPLFFAEALVQPQGLRVHTATSVSDLLERLGGGARWLGRLQCAGSTGGWYLSAPLDEAASVGKQCAHSEALLLCPVGSDRCQGQQLFYGLPHAPVSLNVTRVACIGQPCSALGAVVTLDELGIHEDPTVSVIFPASACVREVAERFAPAAEMHALVASEDGQLSLQQCWSPRLPCPTSPDSPLSELPWVSSLVVADEPAAASLWLTFKSASRRVSIALTAQVRELIGTACDGVDLEVRTDATSEQLLRACLRVVTGDAPVLDELALRCNLLEEEGAADQYRLAVDPTVCHLSDGVPGMEWTIHVRLRGQAGSTDCNLRAAGTLLVRDLRDAAGHALLGLPQGWTTGANGDIWRLRRTNFLGEEQGLLVEADWSTTAAPVHLSLAAATVQNGDVLLLEAGRPTSKGALTVKVFRWEPHTAPLQCLRALGETTLSAKASAAAVLAAVNELAAAAGAPPGRLCDVLPTVLPGREISALRAQPLGRLTKHGPRSLLALAEDERALVLVDADAEPPDALRVFVQVLAILAEVPGGAVTPPLTPTWPPLRLSLCAPVPATPDAVATALRAVMPTLPSGHFQVLRLNTTTLHFQDPVQSALRWGDVLCCVSGAVPLPGGQVRSALADLSLRTAPAGQSGRLRGARKEKALVLRDWGGDSN